MSRKDFRFMHPLSAVLAVCFIFFIFACASFTKNAYRTLATGGEAYNATMMTAADLYQQGRITDKQKDGILKLGHRYRDAYHLAVDTLAAYERTRTTSDEDMARKALLEFQAVAIDLTRLLQTYNDYSHKGTKSQRE